MSTFKLGKRVGGRGAVSCDLDRLVESRLLLQANSGGGKSWAVRRLLEQTHGSVLQLVIDVEDEFHTLREKHDYILAGRHGGDCPADVKSAALLARRLLELGVSAIIGIYELRAHDRIRFVRLFLEALVNAPRTLWRPALVVIDEAHIFCPQTGKAESAEAVIDLATRGRKRGLCPVLATQRISKLHKDAAAECNNKLIGRSALDIDMKRAAEELGLASKEDQRRLRTLAPGHFYAFGPAFGGEGVVEVQVGAVKTTHPKVGQRMVAPPPPPESVKQALAQLADLPQQAEEESRTVPELRRQVAQLEKELRAAKSAAPATEVRVEVPCSVVTPQEVDAIKKAALELDDALSNAVAATDTIEAIAHSAGEAIARVSAGEMPFGPRRKPAGNGQSGRPAPAPRPRRAPVPTTAAAAELGKGPRLVLTAIASLHPRPVTKSQAATLAGYSPRSSTIRNYLSALRTAGLVEGDGNALQLTGAGEAAAGEPEPPRSTEELLELWCPQLGSGPAAILRLLAGEYPGGLSKQAIADATGYSATSSTIRNYLSKLSSNGLMERRAGDCFASDSLFPGCAP